MRTLWFGARRKEHGHFFGGAWIQWFALVGLCFTLLGAAMIPVTHGFVVVVPTPAPVSWRKSLPHSSTTTTITASIHHPLHGSPDSNNDKEQEDNNALNKVTSFLNPYDSKIPKEIEQDIYKAEGNTAAAKDRSVRIALYATVALTGLAMAFFNGFLSELRNSPAPVSVVDDSIQVPPFDLLNSPFAWVDGTGVTRFLFLNKLGGLLSLLIGAGAGLLAEAEFDTRRINAEKIYQEMERRRTLKQTASPRGGATTKKKKRREGTRESKRMGALAEVVEVPDTKDTFADAVDSSSSSSSDALSSDDTTTTTPTTKPADTGSGGGGGGLMDSLQDFYKEADTMAAQQALMLNKKLEDAGVLEKITDETGLRVVQSQAEETVSPDTNLQQQEEEKEEEKGMVEKDSRTTRSSRKKKKPPKKSKRKQ